MTATLLLLLACLPSEVPAADTRPTVLVVVGADGTEEYGKQFRDWAGRWEAATKNGGTEFLTIGQVDPGETNDHDLLKQQLAKYSGTSPEPLWIVLIGHGTFDGKIARFNLRGPDVSLGEISAWLKPIERPLAIVNCASCSGPFLNELSGPNRVVIAATRSGHEYNFARFGDYLSTAISDPQADLDKDSQTSLLEAYLLASSRVREFYEADGRLMTEHALLDDNGDRLGTPADWFQGFRATKSAKSGATVDGQRARQWNLIPSPQEEELSDAVRTRRDQIELELATLRRQKAQVPEADYLQSVEPLLVELAKLYESAAP